MLVEATGCFGICDKGPAVMVEPDSILYQKVKEEDIPRIVEEHIINGKPVKEMVFTPPEEEVPIPKMDDIDFFKYQRLIALRNRGIIDPGNIDDYIAHDGYTALAKALTSMTPEQIIQEGK